MCVGCVRENLALVFLFEQTILAVSCDCLRVYYIWGEIAAEFKNRGGDAVNEFKIIKNPPLWMRCSKSDDVCHFLLLQYFG